MLENEFEKKVQERMDGLRLRPSAGVWNKVEKELKEKKRRRIVFFWFLFAGLGLLGYSGYRWSAHEKPLAAVTSSSQASIAAAPAGDHATGNTSASSPSSSSALEINKNTTVPDSTANGTGNASITSTSSPVTAEQAGVKKKNMIAAASPSRHALSSPVQAAGRFAVTVEQGGSSANTSIVKETGIAAATPSQSGIATGTSQIASAAVAKDSASDTTVTAANSKPLKTDSTTAPVVAGPASGPLDKTVHKKYPEIRWGVDLAGGIAYHRSGLLSLSGNGPDKSLQDVLSQYNAAAGYSAARPPSAVRPGIALKAGVAMELKVSPRSSIISGLQYAYYSETIRVGALSPVVSLPAGVVLPSSPGPGAVYSGYSQNDYTSRYHFIELPLLYQLQPGKKWPVSWNAGIAVRYLTGTNALMYDTTAGGIYYKDRHAFNTFHFALQTGFSVLIGNKGKATWSAGPDVSFDISRQGKQNILAGKRYLFYGGITARMFFNKPKK